MDESIYVFSYGTLRDKYGANEIYDATLYDYFEIDRTGMYPVLIKSDILNEIEGVIIKISENELAEIDHYEDYPKLYNRVKREIGNIMVWLYIEP